MSAAVLSLPLIAVLTGKVQRAMEFIVHIGAHRCASTTFQRYLRSNAAALRAQGGGFWGPGRTRKGGLLSGIVEGNAGAVPPAGMQAAQARIDSALYLAEARGVTHVVLSDENMLGSVRRNLRARALYPDAGPRLAHHARAFGGKARRIVLSIRALDTFWESAMAFGVERGHPLPDEASLGVIANNPRGWRDVITEIAQAFPGVELQVQGFEAQAGQPDRRLALALGGAIEPPVENARLWLNRAPDLARLRTVLAQRGDNPARLPEGAGRWRPFSDAQAATLRETHADDLYWLRAGADGMATYFEEDTPDQAGKNLPGGANARGQDDDGKDGRMARTG